MRRFSAGILAAFLTAGACLAFQTPAKPSLPYKAIEHAEFMPASQATFMSDRDRLIGLTDGKIAKAYPAGILAQHGLVQDKLNAGPIAVTW
jgi:uncharacterized protein DUF3179